LAYSLIPINEATAVELQALRWIGPKRADRILAYRCEVSDILSPADLSAASGLGANQLRDILDSIDWSTSKEGETYNLSVVVVTILTSIATIIFSHYRIGLELTSAPQNVYNIALMLILLGATCGLLDVLIGISTSFARIKKPLTLLGTTFILIGSLMLVSLLFISRVEELSSHLTIHVQTTLIFLVMVFLILSLSSGPSISLTHLIKKASDASRLDFAAMIYDYGHLVLAALVLFILSFANSDLAYEEIFSIWASVMLISNGFEMIRGNSPFVANLSSKEKATLRFLLRQGVANDETSGKALQALAGWWTVGSGLLIIYVVGKSLVGNALVG